MTPGESNATPGQKPISPRQQPRGGRMLSVVHGKNERSLHLSPILQQIKDDGPALIDGEVVKVAASTPRLANPPSANDAKAALPTQPLLADRQVKVLLGFCAALALGLCASLTFSWQQQQRLANVEYMLEVLVTAPR